MTMMHFSNSAGAWLRCRAYSRPGFGVEQCPNFTSTEGSEKPAHLDNAGIARAGGGTISRWTPDGARISTISPLHNGRYTVTTPTRVLHYDEKGTPLIGRKEKLPKVSAAEQRARIEAFLKESEEREAVSNRLKAISTEVETGLAQWNKPEGKEWREKMMDYASAAEKQLYTEDAVALLMVVAKRDDAPKELAPALAVFHEDITSEPDAHAFLTQRAKRQSEEAVA